MAKKGNYFWASYSDLMTSLFFIMLVLFVLTISILNRQQKLLKEQQDKLIVEADAFNKIQELEKSISEIDSKWFEYNENHKKHILKINVAFNRGSADMDNIPPDTQESLLEAGRGILRFINTVTAKYKNAKYLLIIEGQASKDGYSRNDELSYNRALSLRNFWKENNVSFSNNCEVIVAGSGVGGSLRENNETDNQRFLIHIILKPGLFDDPAKSSNKKTINSK
jgi:outer membrane protein OmpA-like peptidoglycan-associated protein